MKRRDKAATTLSSEEYELVKAAARAQRRSVSDWIRLELLDQAKRQLGDLEKALNSQVLR